MAEEKVFQLFEGTCPTCESDTTIVEVSGTAKFLEEQQFLGEHKQNVWNGVCGASDGVVVFRCADGHKHEAWHYTNGDWVS